LVDTLGACRRLIPSITGAEHYTVKGLHALLGWEHSELRVVPEYIALIGEAPESIKDPKETPKSYSAAYSIIPRIPIAGIRNNVKSSPDIL
jgi:hypothetical protein